MRNWRKPPVATSQRSGGRYELAGAVVIMTQLIVIVSEQLDTTFGIHRVTLEFGATEGERQTASVLNSVLGAVIELLKQGDEEALRQLLELCKWTPPS